METKHTKGEWFVYNEKEILHGTESLGIDCKTENGQKTIVVFTDDVDLLNDPEEELANAKLIAEAGTVANETGKTPRQLADLNKELLEALIMAQRLLLSIQGELFKEWPEFQFIQSAIKKATE